MLTSLHVCNLFETKRLKDLMNQMFVNVLLTCISFLLKKYFNIFFHNSIKHHTTQAI
jgi:hypothetical protein